MQDTIAAIATAPGAGGIAIVRVSGPQSQCIAQALFTPAHGKKSKLHHRKMTYGQVRSADGERLDEVMAVFFTAPNSYTREDVLELHCHGGSITAQRILEACLLCGARLAQPGEFTKLAFLNGRMDLAQAEAVMGVIAAESEQAAKLSQAQLDGVLSHKLKALQTQILDVMAELEAAIDYPDDVATEGVEEKLASFTQQLEVLLGNAQAAQRAYEGVRAVIAGRPNAGKSSLLNLLAGTPRAIVTDVAGTTRDVLTERIDLFGVALTLCDTAGLRASEDMIERIGVARAKQEIALADLVLLVWDQNTPLTSEDLEVLTCGKPVLFVKNKSDVKLSPTPERCRTLPSVEISAHTGAGLEELRHKIYELAVGKVQPGETVLCQKRHIEAAQAALEAMRLALTSAQDGVSPEFILVDLRQAWFSLGLITGETADDLLISRIFSQFCLGK